MLVIAVELTAFTPFVAVISPWIVNCDPVEFTANENVVEPAVQFPMTFICPLPVIPQIPV
jgi:hypothetical protein